MRGWSRLQRWPQLPADGFLLAGDKLGEAWIGRGTLAKHETFVPVMEGSTLLDPGRETPRLRTGLTGDPDDS